MAWRYDIEREKVLGCILSSTRQSGIGMTALCVTLKKGPGELRPLLSDLEKAGFIETMERSTKCKITEEGVLRLMKGLSN